MTSHLCGPEHCSGPSVKRKQALEEGKPPAKKIIMKRKNKVWEAQLDLITKKLFLTKEEAKAYKELMRNHYELINKTLQLRKSILEIDSETNTNIVQGYLDSINEAMFYATALITRKIPIFKIYKHIIKLEFEEPDIAEDLLKLSEIQKQEIKIPKTQAN